MDNDLLKSTFTPAGVPAATGTPMAVQPVPMEQEEEGLALGEIIAVLMDYRWLIAAICLVSLLAGVAWVLVARPVFKADGLLQVEEKSAGLGSLKALQPLLGDDTTVSAEIEILGSRMVLGRVVSKLRLDIVAEPRTLPLIGGAIARR